jgi:hypothetical protein
VADKQVVASTRSPELADTVARSLNGEDVPRRDVGDRSPLRRYTSGRDPTDSTRTLIYSAQSIGRHPSAFGDGVIATTRDANLATRIADLLEEIDPEHRRHAKRGFGWW